MVHPLSATPRRDLAQGIGFRGETTVVHRDRREGDGVFVSELPRPIAAPWNSYAPMSTSPSPSRANPSKSTQGAPSIVPLPIAGLSAFKWKSPFAGSTNRGSAAKLPLTPIRSSFATMQFSTSGGVRDLSSPIPFGQKTELRMITFLTEFPVPPGLSASATPAP